MVSPLFKYLFFFFHLFKHAFLGMLLVHLLLKYSYGNSNKEGNIKAQAGT
jgi:hypothetical protein